MKILDIKNLKLNRFEKELNQENFNYIQQRYSSTQRALEVYKEGAELSGEDEYLSINEYFDSDKEQNEDYKSLLELEYAPIDEIMTFAEATEKWGLKDSTLRKLVSTTGKLEEGKDYRKSGKVWIITKDAMQRVYGEPKQK